MKSQECEIATAHEVKPSAAQGQCNIAQSEKVQSAEAQRENQKLLKNMRAFISQNMIEKLIRIERKSPDILTAVHADPRPRALLYLVVIIRGSGPRYLPLE